MKSGDLSKLLDKNNIKKFFCVLFIVVAIGTLLASNRQSNKYVDTMAEGELKIIELETEIKNRESVTSVDKDEIKETYNLVKTAGNAVSDLQNEYSKGGDEAVISEKIEAYFYEDSIDCSVPWYNYDVNSRWVFASQYNYWEDKFNVLWINYENGTNDVLAYAEGVYSTDTNLFSNIEYHNTSSGDNKMYPNEDAYDDSLNDLIKLIRNALGEVKPMTADELKEYQQLKAFQTEQRIKGEAELEAKNNE